MQGAETRRCYADGDGGVGIGNATKGDDDATAKNPIRTDMRRIELTGHCRAEREKSNGLSCEERTTAGLGTPE